VCVVRVLFDAPSSAVSAPQRAAHTRQGPFVMADANISCQPAWAAGATTSDLQQQQSLHCSRKGFMLRSNTGTGTLYLRCSVLHSAFQVGLNSTYKLRQRVGCTMVVCWVKIAAASVCRC